MSTRLLCGETPNPLVMSGRTIEPMGQRAAFFDLDKTLIPGSSLFLLARGMYARDYYRVRDLLRFGWRQLAFRMSGESEKGLESTRDVDARLRRRTPGERAAGDGT